MYLPHFVERSPNRGIWHLDARLFCSSIKNRGKYGSVVSGMSRTIVVNELASRGAGDIYIYIYTPFVLLYFQEDRIPVRQEGPNMVAPNI